MHRTVYSLCVIIEKPLDAALRFHLPTSPPARVLHQIRTLELATRTTLRDTLGISQPSVTRHVRALVEAGLVEERPVEQGAERTGRPHSILVLDGRHLTVWGMHIGVRTTHLVINDGAGRLLREAEIPLVVATLSPEQLVARLIRGMRTLAPGLPLPVHVGVAVSAPLNQHGVVSSPDYGWEQVDLAALMEAELGRPVHIGAGAAAMAAQELLSQPLSSPASSSSTLYFYAREVINHAWIVNGVVHRPHSGRPGLSLHSLARGSVLAEGAEHPFSDAATIAAADRAGITVDSFRELVAVAEKDPTARAIVDARAALLTEAIDLIVDAVDPSVLVLAGEAFTADCLGLEEIVRVLHSRREGTAPLQINVAGAEVTRDAACLAGLFPLWSDPLGYATP